MSPSQSVLVQDPFFPVPYDFPSVRIVTSDDSNPQFQESIHSSLVPDESESEDPIGVRSPEESSLSIFENSPPVILSMS